MNKFLNEGQNYVAECWLPYSDYGKVQSVLQRASVRWLLLLLLLSGIVLQLS